MKALLFSLGARGDIEPFLAVAEILKRRGAEIVCVFPEQFRGEVERIGYDFHGFSSEFPDLLSNPDTQRILGGGGSLVSKIKSWIALDRAGMRITGAANRLQHKVLTAEKPGRVLYRPKCLFVLISRNSIRTRTETSHRSGKRA